MKNLVIVESPAKAKTIEKYLGKDFTVMASVGHIRKDTKVNKANFDVTYEIDPGHKEIISKLKKAAKAAEQIWLATDEDREFAIRDGQRHRMQRLRRAVELVHA